jgi:hypothetical protein
MLIVVPVLIVVVPRITSVPLVPTVKSAIAVVPPLANRRIYPAVPLAAGEIEVLVNASDPCASGETYVIEPDNAVAAKSAVASTVPVAAVSGVAGIVPE